MGQNQLGDIWEDSDLIRGSMTRGWKNDHHQHRSVALPPGFIILGKKFSVSAHRKLYLLIVGIVPEYSKRHLF